MHAETPGISATLARLAEGGMEVDRIATLAALIWCDIDKALAPIIGHVGVAALYRRSLYLARTEHACLAVVYEAIPASDGYTTLKTALSQQTLADATATISALLQTFHDLLTHLIGESLTERLLRSVWDNPSSGHAVQDPLS
jgi:hypothetical protein